MALAMMKDLNLYPDPVPDASDPPAPSSTCSRFGSHSAWPWKVDGDVFLLFFHTAPLCAFCLVNW